MITPSPTEERAPLSPEQRRRLGEVYRRILSWRQEDKKAGKNLEKPVSPQLPNRPVYAHDDASSDENYSKGGANG